MNLPEGRAALTAQAQQMSLRHANRYADGEYRGKRGSYEHYARVIRQAVASVDGTP